MLHPLCLEPLTVMDVSPPEFVAIAAATDCALVSLWVQAPVPAIPAQCIVDGGAVRKQTARTLADYGVRVNNLECFDLQPDVVVQRFRPALENGAWLGARSATAIFREKLAPTRQIDLFSELCVLGAELGLRINVEFVATHRGMTSLAHAVDLVTRANQPNGGIAIDILHLVRSGGLPEDVKKLAPGLVGAAQVCDGPATKPWGGKASRVLCAKTNPG